MMKAKFQITPDKLNGKTGLSGTFIFFAIPEYQKGDLNNYIQEKTLKAHPEAKGVMELEYYWSSNHNPVQTTQAEILYYRARAFR